MTDWNAVTAFMANVVAWPGTVQDPGYVNLHYSMEDRKDPKKKIVTGWPTRTVDDLVQKCAWAMSTNYIKDLWFCTSLQSQAGKNSKGSPKAIRGTQFATFQKSIWIDVDVEPNNPKKYGTIEEALAAILLFAKTVKLPTPSALVFSGSGVHVYWISKTPLTPAEWGPYASGLKSLLLANAVKCDAGLTTDIARILRVPGTLNHKTVPPKPVQLSPLPLRLYDFADLDFLKDYAAPIHVPSALAKPPLFADGTDASKFGKPLAAFAGLADAGNLQGGIQAEEKLLKATPIFKECGFMKHALKTEGADYDNPLWNLSVLCATFMENGNAIAHAISKGHPSYSEADTQALYDRKVAERHDRGLGYPSCATIQGNGCNACASCPLFAKGKSPLNIRPAVTATVNPPQSMGQTPAAQALQLPKGFDVNADGIICKVIDETGRDGETTVIMVPLFQCVLSDFWVQKFPDCLNYTVTVDKGFTHAASVPHSEMSKLSFRSFLGSEGVRTLINGAVNTKFLEEFFLSMLGKLRAAAAAMQAVPFGWYEVNGKRRGFVYGGNVFEDNGTVRPCGIGDPEIKSRYTPMGDIQPWLDAAASVTNRKRPELTAIFLLSFASPLLTLAGKNSVLLSAWGTDSGAGKSSAFLVGMSVWGHPILTKGSESSTRNSVTTQMTEIKNLPFYWDEITDDKFREIVAQVMHEISDGAQKGRNLTGQKAAKRGLFKLMIMAASNGSFREYLQQRNQDHNASLMRVLEWEVKRIDGGPGHLNDADASAILAKLESNYGQMGLRYAQFLAQNHVAIEAEVLAKSNEVEASLLVDGKQNSANRFWIAAVALITLAAKYASQLGVDVDPVEIEAFMREVYRDNEADVQARSTAHGHVDNTETVLGRYLKERAAGEQMLWTDYIHITRGRPRTVSTLKAPSTQRNPSGGIEIRWAVENRLLIIAMKDFEPWVRSPAQGKYSFKAVKDGLGRDYGAQFVQKLQLTSGTAYPGGREPCVVIPVNSKRHRDLWASMMLAASPELRQKALDAEAAEDAGAAPASFADVQVETGFEEVVNG